MSMVRKLPPHIAAGLRKFLADNNISTKKLVIDLETETIEGFDDHFVDDILSVAGILKPWEAKKLLGRIQESRGSWGK